jgi:hypothetical protein
MNDKVAILGAGAIGSILGTYLSNSNLSVSILARGKRLEWFHGPNYLGAINNIQDGDLDFIINSLNETRLDSKEASKETVQKNAFIKAILPASLSPLCPIQSVTMSQAMDGALRHLFAIFYN